MKSVGEIIPLNKPQSAATKTCESHGDYESRFYRERWSGCPKCWDDEQKKRDKAAREESERQMILNRIGLCEIPARYADARLADIQQAEKFEAYIKTVQQGNAGALLVLGQVGTGKTFAACALAREAATIGILTRYETVGRYIRKIKETWDTDTSESSVFESAVSVKLLILDEIGPGLANDKDAVRIHELIAERYDRALPTVYVTNLIPYALKAAVKDRAYDRMRDGATQINMTGESRRKPAAKNDQ